MKHIRTSLLASCLIANLGLVAVAQENDTTSTTASKTEQTTKKRHGLRKHRLRKLFKKEQKTETSTTK